MLMRKIDDLWRARLRSTLTPLQPQSSTPSVQQPIELLLNYSRSSTATRTMRCSTAGFSAVAWGTATMSRELMLLIIDEDPLPVGPMGECEPFTQPWDRWMPYANAEWIDILLDILAIHLKEALM
jgi:hypothetical protein